MLNLLTLASLPPMFSEDALHTSIYLHNILLTKLHNFQTPTYLLYFKHLTYSHLHTYGCVCFTNHLTASHHKLAPRSSCIFLGYPDKHCGYKCLELETEKTFVSRHVSFDDPSLPHSYTSTDLSQYKFLEVDPPSPILYLPFILRTYRTPSTTFMPNTTPTSLSSSPNNPTNLPIITYQC